MTLMNRVCRLGCCHQGGRAIEHRDASREIDEGLLEYEQTRDDHTHWIIHRTDRPLPGACPRDGLPCTCNATEGCGHDDRWAHEDDRWYIDEEGRLAWPAD